MATNELSIGKRLLIALFIITLLSDFAIGNIGKGLDLPTLTSLNTTSQTIKNNSYYIISSISNPVGYPLNATATYSNKNTWFGGIDTLILSIGQGIVDIIYDLANIVINGLLLMASGFWFVIILLFVLFPAILEALNLGVLGVILSIANVFIFGYIGLLAYHVLSDIAGSIVHSRR